MSWQLCLSHCRLQEATHKDCMDLQLSLAACTQVVVKNLCDSIPKLVYAQLVGKVCTPLRCFGWRRDSG